jgi:NADH-quinone oxidoreductase subunit E
MFIYVCVFNNPQDIPSLLGGNLLMIYAEARIFTMNGEREKILKRFTKDRTNLVPILQKVQEAEGYLSPEAVNEVSSYLNVTGNDIYSVASFYAQFRFEQHGKHTIKICQGTACHVRGVKQISDAIERELHIKPGLSITEDCRFTLERVACFGSCALAPIMVIDNNVYGKVTTARAKQLLNKFREK